LRTWAIIRECVRHIAQVAEAGLEPICHSTGKTAISETDSAESGAVGARIDEIVPDLQAILVSWPTLPEAVKAGIVAMIQAAAE